jgi:cell division protein FtsW
MRISTTVLIGSMLALLSLGMLTLYSLSPLHDSMRYLARQLVAAGLGLTGALVLSQLHYRRLQSWSWGLLLGAVVLLVLVLVLGVKVNGARRWFRFGGVQFQPSDFAKLALLVALAHYGSAHERLMRTFWYGIGVPGLLMGLVVGLVFLEPDWGTALLLAASGLVVLLVAGARARFLLPPVLLGVIGFVVLLALDPMRIDRVNAWLHPEATRQGVGYQAWQAKLALGSGGLTGVGLNASTQKSFLPEHQTDFIFAIIGEEFGYVGSLAVIAFFVLFFLSGVSIARQAGDPFGRLLATGISFLIGLQAFINVAVVSSALPNKGLALPFVSYGGSNLTMLLLCTGVLVSVARHSHRPIAPEADVQDLGQPETAAA